MRAEHISAEQIWPSGDSRPIAVLSLEPNDLAEKYGWHFREGIDDLDLFKFVVIQLEDGSPAMVYKHHGDSNPGTLVRVDAHANLCKERKLLFSKLHLKEGDLLWVAPEARRRRAAFV